MPRQYAVAANPLNLTTRLFAQSILLWSPVKRISIGSGARFSAQPDEAHEAKKTEKCSAWRKRNDTQETHATTICGGYRDVLCRADHRALCPQRLRRRQALDRSLG